jgi:microsomal dipeptidase-like Zn-dependent dipeptidase
LTDALLGAGFSEGQIRSIMGRNVQRVLHRVLPP